MSDLIDISIFSFIILLAWTLALIIYAQMINVAEEWLFHIKRRNFYQEFREKSEFNKIIREEYKRCMLKDPSGLEKHLKQALKLS